MPSGNRNYSSFCFNFSFYGFIFYFWIKFDSVSGLHKTAKNAYMCVWSEHLMISSGHTQICSLIHCLSYWSFCESIYEFKPIKKTCYAHWKGEQRSGTRTSDLCVFTLNLTCSQSHWIEVAVCTCVCVFNWKKPLFSLCVWNVFLPQRVLHEYIRYKSLEISGVCSDIETKSHRHNLSIPRK